MDCRRRTFWDRVDGDLASWRPLVSPVLRVSSSVVDMADPGRNIVGLAAERWIQWCRYEGRADRDGRHSGPR